METGQDSGSGELVPADGALQFIAHLLIEESLLHQTRGRGGVVTEAEGDRGGREIKLVVVGL